MVGTFKWFKNFQKPGVKTESCMYIYIRDQDIKMGLVTKKLIVGASVMNFIIIMAT